MFGTGAWWGSGTHMQDGVPATSATPLFPLDNPFRVDFYGVPVSIQYAGLAPGIINGVFQLNVQLPIASNPRLMLRATDIFGVELFSNPVYVYAR